MSNPSDTNPTGGPYPAEAYHGIFPSADDSAGSIGETLRRTREAQGYSLVDVANTLKIRRVYLEAIESGRLDDLPTGPAYASGFVRSYAQALGLDPEPLLARLPDELAGAADAPLRRAPRPRPDSSAGRMPGLTLAATGLVLAAIAGFIWLSIGDDDARDQAAAIPPVPGRAADQPAPPPAERIDVGALPAEPQDAPPAPAESQIRPTERAPDPASASEDPELPASEDMGAAEGALPATDLPPIPPPRPRGPNDETAIDTAPPPAEPAGGEGEAPAEQAPAATAEPAIAENVLNPNDPAGRVSLYAVDSVWIQVKGPDGDIYTRVLRKGDVWRVPDEPGLSVNVGTPNLLELRLDGQRVGLAGAGNGFVTGVPLDPNGLAGVNP